MLFFYFLVEILFLFILVRKYKTPNVLVLAYVIFLIYAQSTYIKHLFFGVDQIEFNQYYLLNFKISSDAYFMASTCYFLFMLSFGLIASFIKTDGLFVTNKKVQILQINFKLKIFILLLVSYILLYYVSTLGFDRELKKQFSIIQFDFVIYYLAFYLWAFLFFYSNYKNKYFYLLTFAVLLYAVFSFEREFVAFIAIVFLFKYKHLFRSYKMIFSFLIAYIFMLNWKHFYVIVITDSNSLSTFYEFIKLNSFVNNSETAVGISLLTNYFQNDIYGDYYLSYITNIYNQFIRVFIDTGYNSLAEFSSSYYTSNRMGTAFSMILESILNFGLIGPILLPLFIIRVFIKILKKKIKLYDFYSVFLIFILLKLVRTELAVLLKLYILPFLLFMFLLRFFLKKKNNFI